MSGRTLAGPGLLMLLTMLATPVVASNPADEQVVRNAYAKLAYAAQSHTVYREASRHPKLTGAELAAKLAATELRFEITDMSSGSLADIASRTYSDLMQVPDAQPVLSISFGTQTVNENGKRFTSNFADPHWQKGEGPRAPEQGWDLPVKDAMAQTIGKNFTRYVTATVTVSFEGRSRTYHTLWLFGPAAPYDILAVDTVTGQIVRDFALKSAYPSVLTDTSLRSHPVVSEWLAATQRYDSSCKTGKQDVCCDQATGRCGVHADDLRSTKPAPTTTARPKGGL